MVSKNIQNVLLASLQWGCLHGSMACSNALLAYNIHCAMLSAYGLQAYLWQAVSDIIHRVPGEFVLNLKPPMALHIVGHSL